jgi:hypothetical protein
MTDSRPDHTEREVSGKTSWRMQYGILTTVCALVVGVYAYAAFFGFMATTHRRAADADYNRLVDGFRAGQLNLKVDVPTGFTQLADPYDPAANALYRTAKYGLYDLSYPDSADAHHSMGVILMESGNGPKAVKQFTLALLTDAIHIRLESYRAGQAYHVATGSKHLP